MTKKNETYQAVQRKSSSKFRRRWKLQGGQFGAEHTQRKMSAQTRGRSRQARRVSTGLKRKLKERSTPTLSRVSLLVMHRVVQMSQPPFVPFAIRESRSQ